MILLIMQRKFRYFNKIILIWISFLLISARINAQSSISFDSVKVNLVWSGQDEISVTIFNLSKCTPIEVFNTYFETFLSTNKYLYRYRTKESSMVLSYLPLTNFLGTVNSDLIYTNDDVVFKRNQLKYSFVKILPNQECNFKLAINRKLLTSSDTVILDFDPNSITKLKVTKGIRSSVNNIFKMVFAIYSTENAAILRQYASEYLSVKQFVKNAKKYKTIEMKMHY